MSTQTFDVIVVGAGSVGLPTAWSLAEAGVTALVIDQFPGPGQGSNKAAIGGIRATHSTPAKIRLCLDSFRIFSTWQQIHGDSIEWAQGGYASQIVINAGGAWARAVAQSAGLDAPVVPDSHEAGITEPVAPFMTPMAVDVRPAEGSHNYYFYQHRPGSVVFCITPDPPIVGTDRRETSSYLPMVARRMVDLIPRLANIKVRRTWRGLYPMTPDGSPIVGPAAGLEGYIHAVGMCGQGYMLGPGVGALVSRLVGGTLTDSDRRTLDELTPARDFGADEALQ